MGLPPIFIYDCKSFRSTALSSLRFSWRCEKKGFCFCFFLIFLDVWFGEKLELVEAALVLSDLTGVVWLENLKFSLATAGNFSSLTFLAKWMWIVCVCVCNLGVWVLVFVAVLFAYPFYALFGLSQKLKGGVWWVFGVWLSAFLWLDQRLRSRWAGWFFVGVWFSMFVLDLSWRRSRICGGFCTIGTVKSCDY